MLIFFDTEFSDLGIDPRLVSIGLISDDGREFYAELADTYVIGDCNEFVKLAVLPKLEGGAVRMTMFDLTLKLGNWLDDFEEPVQLATDSLGWDWPWVHEIFYEAGTWPQTLSRTPQLLTVNDLNDYGLFISVVEKAFAGGLRRHHALDDAKANRLGWIAAGGCYAWPETK